MTADALSYYGYQTTICWVCWSSFGPREMGDKTKPVMPPGALDNPEYIEPPPDAVPDISATSESNLIDAWNGTGPYASDGKQRRNYRVIAVIRTSTYMLAAASKKSGITNLRQIKDRTEPTWIVGNNADHLRLLRHQSRGSESQRRRHHARPNALARETGLGRCLHRDRPPGEHAGAAVLVRGQPIERSRVSGFRRAADRRLAQEPGYQRATVPLALFRGVDRPIPTVMRPNHFIYVRDEAPDVFAYAVAKALDEHRELFQVQLEPWYYDPQTVAVSKVIPMHPGAMKYYRERGYVK